MGLSKGAGAHSLAVTCQLSRCHLSDVTQAVGRARAGAPTLPLELRGHGAGAGVRERACASARALASGGGKQLAGAR